MTAKVTRAAVQQELARARGARRMLPWATLTAVGGAALGAAAGGGVRGAAVLFAVGLLFAVFAAVMSIARCPACGASLPVPRAARAKASRDEAAPPDPAGGEPLQSCPRCRTRFE